MCVLKFVSNSKDASISVKLISQTADLMPLEGDFRRIGRNSLTFRGDLACLIAEVITLKKASAPPISSASLLLLISDTPLMLTRISPVCICAVMLLGAVKVAQQYIIVPLESFFAFGLSTLMDASISNA